MNNNFIFQGCQERHSPFSSPLPGWSAFRNNDYGYSRMYIHNKTHLEILQVSDDKKGQIVDQFFIVKDKPIPYWLNSTFLNEMSNEINVIN